MHQPLHCTALFSESHFPKGDRGGNEIPLKRGKNLHSLWDGLLGRNYYMRDVQKAVAELSDRRKYGKVWQTARTEMDPRKWAEESHQLGLAFVYDSAILTAARNAPHGTKMDAVELTDSYYTIAGEHARNRVLAAGLRLANLLTNP